MLFDSHYSSLNSCDEDMALNFSSRFEDEDLNLLLDSGNVFADVLDPFNSDLSDGDISVSNIDKQNANLSKRTTNKKSRSKKSTCPQINITEKHLKNVKSPTVVLCSINPKNPTLNSCKQIAPKERTYSKSLLLPKNNENSTVQLQQNIVVDYETLTLERIDPEEGQRTDCEYLVATKLDTYCDDANETCSYVSNWQDTDFPSISQDSDYQSILQDSDFPKRQKCMSRNAIVARESRQRQKALMKDMSNKIETLATENFEIKEKYKGQCKLVQSLESEIKYLRSVVANGTALSSLLKNIQSTAGMQFNTSLTEKDKFDENENVCVSTPQKSVRNSKQVVHVPNRNVKEGTLKRKAVVTKSEPNPKIVKVTIPSNGTTSVSGPLTPCASPVEGSSANEEMSTSGGVCLHVSNNKVSLEFCSMCANSATNAWNKKRDHTYVKP